MAAQRHWYSFALQVARTPDHVLKTCTSLTRAERCTLRAIARLHPEIGRLLDEFEVPLNICKQIGHAPGAAAQWDRAEQLLAKLIERRALEQPRRARLEAEILHAAIQASSGPHPRTSGATSALMGRLTDGGPSSDASGLWFGRNE